MKILVCDGLNSCGQKILVENGFELVSKHYEPDDLVKNIGEYDCMIVRSATKVTKEVIDAGTNLKAICRAGTGIDNIDHVYARSKGIEVLNAPGANSYSVAELVLGHMLALSRFITQAKMAMQKGEWNKKQYKGTELAGKTIGIVGYGRIGHLVAKLMLAIGMKVIAYDVNVQEPEEGVTFTTDKEKILRESDFLTLHVPKLAKPFIGVEELEIMKPTAYIINISRGNAIDEKALLNALNSGKLAGAGLDVFETEPKFNPELAAHPKISITPHIGANTYDALDRVAALSAENIVKFFRNL